MTHSGLFGWQMQGLAEVGGLVVCPYSYIAESSALIVGRLLLTFPLSSIFLDAFLIIYWCGKYLIVQLLVEEGGMMGRKGNSSKSLGDG